MELIAPDLECCQATGCQAKADYILTEAEPGEDGQVGSMTMCVNCKRAFEEQMGDGYVTFESIVPYTPRSFHPDDSMGRITGADMLADAEGRPRPPKPKIEAHMGRRE